MKKFFGFVLILAIFLHPALLLADDNVPAAAAEAAQKAVSDATVKADHAADDMVLGEDEDDDEALDITDETDKADKEDEAVTADTAADAGKAETAEDTADDLDEK